MDDLAQLRKERHEAWIRRSKSSSSSSSSATATTSSSTTSITRTPLTNPPPSHSNSNFSTPPRRTPPFIDKYKHRMERTIVSDAPNDDIIPSSQQRRTIPPPPDIIDLTLTDSPPPQPKSSPPPQPKLSPPTNLLLPLTTYNLWFQPPFQTERMTTIAALIPDDTLLLALQEVTPSLSAILYPRLQSRGYTIVSQNYQGHYGVAMAFRRGEVDVVSSGFLPFRSSQMERGLLWIHAMVRGGDDGVGVEVLFGTSHLESWIPGCDGREERARQILEVKDFCEGYLKDVPSINAAIFTGDLNWDDERKRSKGIDDPMMGYLGDGWLDAWKETMNNDDGYTYDAKANPMLGGQLRRRFDRFLILFNPKNSCCTGQIVSSSLIGKNAIPGLKWKKEIQGWKGNAPTRTKVVPVTPSDHYGLTTILEFQKDDKKSNSKRRKKRKAI